MIRTIIPFYSGNQGFRRASYQDNRELHLEKTLNSVSKFSNVTVFTCTIEDTMKAKEFTNDVIQLICAPKDLIYSLVTYSQNSIKEEYVLYTDSDHVFIYKELPLLDYPFYAVPHRLEEVGTERSKSRGKLVSMLDKEFVIINSSDKGIINNKVKAYSGCYLTTTKLFNEINFKNIRPENPAGFDIFMAPHSICVKTEDFYVEHLSGKDYNAGY